MSTNHNWYCLVCREKMSIHEADDEDLADAESLERRVLEATSCGHVFHKFCLEKSCDSKRVHQQELGLPVTESDSCPFCDREIEMADNRRIYPTELPEDLGLENLTIGNEQELRKKIEELTAEVHRLKATTNIQKAALKKTTTAPTSTSSSRASASATVYGHGHIRGGPTAPTATQRDFMEVQENLETCGFLVDNVSGSSGVAIKQGDAVVWFTDENPSGDAGIVRWLGSVSRTVYAGIQFDNPSGTRFRSAPPNGVILFQASSGNTGWLVRIQELMMYKDFHGHDYYPPGPEDFQLHHDYDDDYDDDD